MIELLVVVAILGVLASIAIQRFDRMTVKAKRTEAMYGLGALWTAEKTYYNDHGSYAGTFDVLSLAIEGGRVLGPTMLKGHRYTYVLSQPKGPGSWYCVASGNLDSDPWPDVVIMHDDDH